MINRRDFLIPLPPHFQVVCDKRTSPNEKQWEERAQAKLLWEGMGKFRRMPFCPSCFITARGTINDVIKYTKANDARLPLPSWFGLVFDQALRCKTKWTSSRISRTKTRTCCPEHGGMRNIRNCHSSTNTRIATAA